MRRRIRVGALAAAAAALLCADAQAATQVAAANKFTCGLAADNTVRCWGSTAGLGIGARTRWIGDDEPAGSGGAVDLGATDTATAVAAGDSHVCAIRTAGTVVCWGFGTSGELGNGSNNDIGDNELPGATSVDIGGAPGTAKALSGGFAFTCAIRTDDTVVCWGAGALGRLGRGNQVNIGDNEAPGASNVDLGTAGDTAKAITTGFGHACAIRGDDKVVCWGSGNAGQLGYGDTLSIGDDEPAASPGHVTVELGTDDDTAKGIAAGNTHTCAIRTDDKVVCWGTGSNGQLGYGDNNVPIGKSPTTLPGTVAGHTTVNLGPISTAKAIMAGDTHTCAIRTDDTLVCWGIGVGGVLGYGSTFNIGDDAADIPINRVVDLGPVSTVKEIDANTFSTCAVRTDDSTVCWGDRYGGRLGQVTPTSIGDDEAPGNRSVNLGSGAQVAAPATLATTTALDAAESHTCALRTGGIVTCWGIGSSGRLGYGNISTIGDDETPRNRAVDLGGGALAKAVTTGQRHSCAIRADDTVVCWGSGSEGALGYGNTSSIGDDAGEPGTRTVDLGAEDRVKAITAGDTFTCAIRLNDRVVCWGDSASGKLGYGLGSTNAFDIGDNESPGELLVDLGAVDTAKAIAAGDQHVCAIRTDDFVVCWGSGGGQLGNGNTTTIGDDETPSVTANLGATSTVKQISAGDFHTCAIRTDDSVVCFGSAFSGQLGYGNQNALGDNEVPGAAAVDLGTVDTAKALAVGANHTCAIRTDNSLVCWGRNDMGQLGYGDTLNIGDDEVPGVRVVALGVSGPATAISAGGPQTCALRTGGTVACWGSSDTISDQGMLGTTQLRQLGDDETPAVIGDPPTAACNYTGPAGGNWRVAGSWSCVAIPGAGDNVIIDGSDDVAVTQNEAAATLTFQDGTIRIDATRTLTVSGATNMTEGTLLGAGTLAVGAFSKVSAFQLDLGATATLRVTGAGTWSGGAICAGDQSTLAVTGTLTIASGASGMPCAGTGSKLTVLGGGQLIDANPGITPIANPVENAGTVTVNATNTLDVNGGYTQTAGTTTVSPGAELETTVALAGGVLGGSGNVDGAVANSGGSVRPGASPGTLSITGPYTQGSNGTLQIEVAGTIPGTGFDRLLVGGAVTLAGTLAIVQGAGFDPAVTDAFHFLISPSAAAGTFATVTGTDLPSGKKYAVEYPAAGPDFGARLKVTPAASGGGGTGGGGDTTTPPPDTTIPPADTTTTTPASPGGASQPPSQSAAATQAAADKKFVAEALALFPSVKQCASRRNFRIRLRQPKGTKIIAAVVKLQSKVVTTRKGKRITAPVDLRGLPKGTFTVRITLVLSDGRVLIGTRKYKTCARKK